MEDNKQKNSNEQKQSKESNKTIEGISESIGNLIEYLEITQMSNIFSVSKQEITDSSSIVVSTMTKALKDVIIIPASSDTEDRRQKIKLAIKPFTDLVIRSVDDDMNPNGLEVIAMLLSLSLLHVYSSEAYSTHVKKKEISNNREKSQKRIKSTITDVLKNSLD